MTDIVFTAVAATDIITSVAHGLNTGDGPCAVLSLGGTVAAPLAPTTDYFFIRLTADTGKLALTNALALAGTAIDLTTAGTGTQHLQVGLPFRRPRTYAAAAQVRSADLNAMSDSLVALYDLLTGQTQGIYTGITLPANQHVAVSGTGKFKHGTRTLTIGPAGMAPIGANGSYNLASFAAGASTSVQCAIHLPVGARILAVRAYIQDSSVGPTPVQLVVFGTGTTGAVTGTFGTSSNSAGTSANQTLSVTGLTTVLAAGNGFVAVVQRASGTAAFNVFLFEIDYDEP